MTHLKNSKYYNLESCSTRALHALINKKYITKRYYYNEEPCSMRALHALTNKTTNQTILHKGKSQILTDGAMIDHPPSFKKGNKPYNEV